MKFGERKQTVVRFFFLIFCSIATSTSFIGDKGVMSCSLVLII